MDKNYKPIDVEIKLTREEFNKLLNVRQLDRVIFVDDTFRAFTVYNLVADESEV